MVPAMVSCVAAQFNARIGGSRGRRMFVLLAEDDSFNRLGLGLFLKQAGYDVIEATDARTARSLAAVWPLDAAIVDIVLPLEPGLLVQQTANVGVDLARDLKHIRPGMGVVIFSAYPDRGSGVFEMLRNGTRGIAYKLKGCDPADFLDAVNAVVAGRVVIDGEITDAASLANELLRQLSMQNVLGWRLFSARSGSCQNVSWRLPPCWRHHRLCVISPRPSCSLQKQSKITGTESIQSWG